KDGIGFRRRSTFCAAIASKSARTRVRGTPRDVRPLVIADAEATELIQPSKCPLDDPAQPAQPAPVLGAAHSDQRHDMPRPQPTPNGGCVVAAIPEHTVWPPSRSPPFAVQRGNRIDQRHGFLRVVPIRAGETYGERHASPVANQMTLAPALGRSVGF